MIPKLLYFKRYARRIRTKVKTLRNCKTFNKQKRFLRGKPLIVIQKKLYLIKNRKRYIKALHWIKLRGTTSRFRRKRRMNLKKKQRSFYVASLWRRKREIKGQIVLSTNIIKIGRRVRNIRFKSYFNRFILKRYRFRYKRSLGLYLRGRCRITSLEQEETAFFFKNKRYNRLRLKFGDRLRISRNFAYLLKRTVNFTFATIYISHRRHNTFMTVINHKNKVVFKTSAGNEGYTGLKRPTKVGRESVANATAKYVKKHFKLIDIVFIKCLARRFHFMLRAFLKHRSVYIRNFIDDKRRAYALARRKKIRRI